MAKLKPFQLFQTTAGVMLFSFPALLCAKELPAVAKWQRLEITLKSAVAYTNALQEAELRALLVSPLGETNRIYGFWDGGKTWRVRYQPNFPGRWTYYTMCSDTANPGLHEQTGEFLCTGIKGQSRFDLHGPVQVARDQQHLEHADRTPFLWLGDAAWLAAIRSTGADWNEYVQTRAAQKFNAVQWRLHPGGRGEKQTAFSGRERIKVNLEFFRELDAKVGAANRAGLLSAIAPLWEIGAPADAPLPEDQAVLLLRYAVARWGADNVAWLVAFECDSTGAQAKRWQNIGRAVFSYVSHAPVILLAGESVWALDAFRRERWVDVLGVQTAMVADENSLPWLLNGPLRQERQKIPPRPLISIAPPMEVAATPNSGQIMSDFARRLMWWSLLLNTPSGVSYGAHEVADWTASSNSAPTQQQPWRRALVLPGAGAIAPLAIGIGGKDFWRLTPFAQALVTQPGLPSTHSIAVAGAQPRDLFLFYVAEERTVNAAAHTVSACGHAVWFDPRTGASHTTTGAKSDPAIWRFTSPSPEDWLLVLTPQPAQKPRSDD